MIMKYDDFFNNCINFADPYPPYTNRNTIASDDGAAFMRGQLSKRSYEYVIDFFWPDQFFKCPHEMGEYRYDWQYEKMIKWLEICDGIVTDFDVKRFINVLTNEKKEKFTC